MIKNYSLALIAAAVSADPWVYTETTYTATVGEGFLYTVATQTVTKTATLSIEETEAGSGSFDVTFTKRFDVEHHANFWPIGYTHHLAIVDEGSGSQYYLDAGNSWNTAHFSDSLEYPVSDNGWGNYFTSDKVMHTTLTASDATNNLRQDAGLSCVSGECYEGDTPIV